MNRQPVQGRGGLCHYYSNDSSWMNQTIFHDWLCKLNSLMFARNRKILLLIENCRPHYVKHLQRTNVCVEFLPKNTTSFLQPLDQGIIRAWKAYYRRGWVSWTLTEFEEGRYNSVLDISDAIMMACRAWGQIKPSTFSNCWIKTGIVPGTAVDEVQDAKATVQMDSARDQEDVQLLLSSAFKDLNFDDQDISEFICDPDEEKDGYEIPSITDILVEKNLISVDQPSEDLVVSRIFTLREARSGAQAIMGYLKTQPTCLDMAKSINNIISYLDLQQLDKFKQRKLSFTQNMDTT